MKKVFGAIAKIAFTLFTLGVFGMLMAYTFSALGRLFPGDIGNQIWGMILFDIAAIVWALAFVFESRSLGQYALAAIGFLTAFVGTVGMVAAEVLLAGGQFAEQAQEISKWMTYGFILVTILHVSLLYAHHAAAPEVDEQIRVGVARGEIVSHAINEAEKGLDTQKAQLAQAITADIIGRVARDLSLQAYTPRVLDLPALPVDDSLNANANGWPMPRQEEVAPVPVFFDRLKNLLKPAKPEPIKAAPITPTEPIKAAPTYHPMPVTPAQDEPTYQPPDLDPELEAMYKASGRPKEFWDNYHPMDHYPVKPARGGMYDEYGDIFWMAKKNEPSTGDVMDGGECAMPRDAWQMGDAPVSKETNDYLFQVFKGTAPHCRSIGTNPRRHKAIVCQSCPLYKPKELPALGESFRESTDA